MMLLVTLPSRTCNRCVPIARICPRSRFADATGPTISTGHVPAAGAGQTLSPRATRSGPLLESDGFEGCPMIPPGLKTDDLPLPERPDVAGVAFDFHPV